MRYDILVECDVHTNNKYTHIHMNRFVYWITIYLPNTFTVTIDMCSLSRGQAIFKISSRVLYTALEIDFVGLKYLICVQKIR